MSVGLEHSVQIEVDAPIDLVWGCGLMEQMPRWMKWIESVKVLETRTITLETQYWRLNLAGYRILRMVPHQIIEWQSVDGLPNRGAIRFMTVRTVVLSNLLLPTPSLASLANSWITCSVPGTRSSKPA